ncbi:ABC transporter substrate-binding protein [Marinomonas posidonica]|uniref:ABC-type transporter, periplasmic subunit n=1 Tax=Marinomonas posidonica (strain CECT 7376 / NCIMB 14433 / IVIA-Po-181) TaxID=491952 RepID=F6CSK2_MARPP|nr:ABC transporter substrate-binding protein [Marinomonas posidonica]AEF56160.1 ABC-type transporter, periplasmic subunit [Marinomonas posidonica IVIA-Po-181]
MTKTHPKNICSNALISTSFSLALFSLPAQAHDYPVTVQSCDRQVTFEQAPKAAVSNDVNLTEMMLALKLQDHMVGFTGVSGWKTLDPKLRKDIGQLPELSAKYPTKEVLLGADADFYFAGWNYGMRVGGGVTPQTLAPLGIKVYELTESCIHIMDKPKVSMKDMYLDLLNLGRIFNVEERAKELVSNYQEELADFQASLPPLTKPIKAFVYDSGEEQPFTSGRFGMPSALIQAAGGDNILDDVAKSWTQVGWESVIDRAPDVIIIVNYGQVTAEQKIQFMRSNPAFKNIPAVKNNQFVVLEYVEATPGPRNIDAVKRLAKAFRAAQ